MSFLEKCWYNKNPVVWLLWPVTALFWLISTVRRISYQNGWRRTHRLSVPVIIVGNISVGGTGKTPLVIRLAQLLRQEGYHPGILSRGYGGKNIDYPHFVAESDSPANVGDEPALMRQHVQCPIVIDPNRARGGDFLLKQHRCDVILCDDGLQHYALERDIEIVVMDGQRRLGNNYLLPMGPLRESAERLEQVDFVVINGGMVRKGDFLMSLESGRLVNIKHPSKSQSLSDLKSEVTAVAAIGNPQRFFDLLKSRQVKLKQCLTFADHHAFKQQDLPQGTVIMTEKDAVKCKDFAADDWWYLPVSAKLTEEFRQLFLKKIKAIKTHGIR
ncbi:tetraacyldisaccharide 4'-kinase [Neptunicella marina]|uniref:Tetraacyldisaccharide 4'-kinase n=1 Tax=Neptunicella marina TaxID=2125989 RepID=A0A8J6IX86_9ALTE|nr:tetraacyldisaccharide 4'-kinase [Neptunicella marina]MBC3767008.1 tetraacyldisaccharide 4'-kinase [Neptunicella marina]